MAVRIAQSFVQESEHKYEKFMLGVDFDRDKMLEMFPTARTFPQIKIDGKSIGGYNEFERIIREHV
jgi:glutaredoxin